MKAVRNTKQKQLIANAVTELNHPTAAEIHTRVREDMEGISLGTVYRVLDQMAAEGRLSRLHFASGEDIFDKTVAPHIHIRCRVCSKVRDVMLSAPLSLESFVSDAEDFTVENSHTEFTGICSECRKSREQ